MSRLKNFTALWVTALVIISYFTLFYLNGYYNSKFAADWLALIGLSFMSISTFPVAYRAALNGIRSDRDRFIFSYWLIWTMIFIHRIWVIVLSLAGQPEWLRYGPISGAIAIGFALASGYGAAAPLTGDIPLNKRELIIFSLAAGFSGIIAGITIGVFILAGWVN